MRIIRTILEKERGRRRTIDQKPQTLWHSLKIHPYGPDADIQRAERRPIISQNYEEVIFNEPVEQFYDILTGGGPANEANTKPGKGGKSAAAGKGGQKSSGKAIAASPAVADHGARTAEIPLRSSRENPYSRETEGKELDRMKDAIRKVEEMIQEERDRLQTREETLEDLRKTEGIPPKKR